MSSVLSELREAEKGRFFMRCGGKYAKSAGLKYGIIKNIDKYDIKSKNGENGILVQGRSVSYAAGAVEIFSRSSELQIDQ